MKLKLQPDVFSLREQKAVSTVFWSYPSRQLSDKVFFFSLRLRHSKHPFLVKKSEIYLCWIEEKMPCKNVGRDSRGSQNISSLVDKVKTYLNRVEQSRTLVLLGRENRIMPNFGRKCRNIPKFG